MIADEVGVRYQHARKVLHDAGLLPMAHAAAIKSDRPEKARPELLTSQLLAHGFALEAQWSLGGFGLLLLDPRPVRGPGVYAFALGGVAQYVGVASRCLANRLDFYRNPPQGQRTNVRLKALLLGALEERETIDILVARPGMGDWNGFPVHLSAGLELGLIRTYHLAWNKQG